MHGNRPSRTRRAIAAVLLTAAFLVGSSVIQATAVAPLAYALDPDDAD
jgi:hypothetical protein